MAFVVCAHQLGRQFHQSVKGYLLRIVSRVLFARLRSIAIASGALLRSDHTQQQAISHLNPAQLIGTNLVFNVLIFWILTYPIKPEDVTRFSPLVFEHRPVGQYAFSPPESVSRGHLRHLRNPTDALEDVA
jgi:hypothetical protein